MDKAKSSAKNKILIIDSGMKNLGGHNFSYTRAVQDALAERGFEADVLVNKLLPADLAQHSGYKPTFTHGTYDAPPQKKTLQVLAHIYAQSVIYANELEQELDTKLFDYAAIFCHTIADFELIGWKRFLARHQLNAHLMLLMRWTPKFQKMNLVRQAFHPYLRIKPHYLNSIYSKLKGRFTLLTDSDSLTRDYASAYKHKIVTMPIPINKYFLDKKENHLEALNKFKDRYGFAGKKGICIGYMGEARRAKGFHLLPDLIRSILAKTDNVYFAIQCPKPASDSDNSSLPQGVNELYEIAKKAKHRLILISERLSEEDYANMFRCLDIVLVPYLLPNYTEATSGIFAEAVALGKPTIVTENTWMAHELKKFGGGLEIKSDNSQDLREKSLQLIERYSHFAAKVHDYSVKWREFHNSHTLTELLLNEIEK